MQLLIGLDIGTTAEKVALFDQNGKMLAVSTQEYDLITPAVNYVEEEPEVYWQAFKAGLEDLKAQYPMTKKDTYALSISAQGETLFFMDENGKSLRNAIVWMDNRAVDEADSLKKAFGDEQCYRVTGQVSFEPCWPASKIIWVRDHEPEVFQKTRTFALIEDYFIHRMTGQWVAEGSLVCSTTYWNIITKKYWTEVLDFIGITEDQLPPVRESGEVVGKLLPEIAEELGIGDDVTICTGCLDQVAGAIGIGNIHEGMFSENIGAALAVVCPVSKPMFDSNRTMPLHYFAEPDTYMIHTFTNGGMTQRWFRDKFCQPEMSVEALAGIDAYSTLSAEAAKVPAGSDGLVMLPHLSGSMAPDMNAKAKGVWFGFIPDAEAVRAVNPKEYNAYQSLDARSIMGVPFGQHPLGFMVIRNLKRFTDHPESLQLACFASMMMLEQIRRKRIEEMTRNYDEDDGKLHVRFNFLGPHSVVIKGREIYEQDLKHPNRRAWVALLYMALHQTPVDQYHLIAENWPDEDEETARGTLRQALFRINNELGAYYNDTKLVVLNKGMIDFSDQVKITTDADEMEELLTKAKHKYLVFQALIFTQILG